ncbi:hypothetical protein IE81DRAFT_285631 [Ceraceosorus guamensis]|uniref:Arabinosidase n=1 Tax=Ceraceosorus guamensis TaxID=1522189 RepID=A0A316W6D7_9BASI|nr:hypothetical protein IE81DRAFT_285631 [Ceraceosorus guamensis]PWN45486.1 hypothetical protein IE81DRAFT_285631 [Ceraceosorus guamensis]
MHFSLASITACLALVASTRVSAAPTSSSSPSTLSSRAEAKVGYLASNFLGGNVQSVYFSLSRGNDALSFRMLNGGQPVLTPASGQGTGGARDPYLVASPDGKTFWQIATDLDIGKTTWGDAVRTGSRAIYVWTSTNLVDWSPSELVNVEDATAGMVWAPSAHYNSATQEYTVFWSSRFYAENDPDHKGAVVREDTIRYATTKDFKTFSAPKNYLDATPFIDQEFLPLDNGGWARFLKNESSSVVTWQTTSDTSLLSSDWQDHGAVTTAAREGPAAFHDNNDASLIHLWLDDFSGPGRYLPYSTKSVTAGPWAQDNAPNFPNNLRHGSVIQLNQQQYDALSQKWPA